MVASLSAGSPRTLDTSACWDRVFSAVPENLRNVETAMRYCCAYRHVEDCWGTLDESNMVYDKSQGYFLDFTYSYATCCFQTLHTESPLGWMLEEIEEDFAFWKGKEIKIKEFGALMDGEFAYELGDTSNQAVEAHRQLVSKVGGARMTDDLRLCRFEMVDGDLLHCDLEAMPNYGRDKWCNASNVRKVHRSAIAIDQTSTYSQLYPLLQALMIVALNYHLPDIVFYVSERDFEWKQWPIPVLTISKHVNSVSSIRVPSHYVVSPVMKRMQTDVATHMPKYPFAERKERLFWRGTAACCWEVTDCAANVDPRSCPPCHQPNLSNFDQHPRYRLAMLASLHPDLLDVKLRLPYDSGLVDPAIQDFLSDRNLFYSGQDASLPETDFLQEHLSQRFILSIDGSGHADREWLFLLGSCQFLYRAQIEAYSTTRGLVPWVHFVPVNHDLSNLIQQVLWAREHAEACQEIALNALEFAVEAYTPEAASQYLLEVVLSYASLTFSSS